MEKDDIVLAFKRAFKHTIPVLTGFLFLGMAYGILMKTKGYGAGWSVLASCLTLAGSMQYLEITLLTMKFDPFQAFILSILINARHMFYGLSMLKKYKGMGKLRAFLIFSLCDETYCICSNVNPPNDVKPKYFYFAISFLDYCYWVIGTFLGAIAGSFIKFNTDGLDFVLTALFIVLFIDKFSVHENKIPCIVGLFCTLICLLIFGAANFVIPSMIFILIILTFQKKMVKS